MAASGLLLVALAVSGCASTSGGPSADSPPAPVAQLDFTARTVTGATFEGRQLAGKPAVLWFWSPWCPTCRAQAPAVTALAKKHAGKVSVVGVGGLDGSDAIRDYGSQLNAFPQLDDAKGDIWKRFGVTAQSSYVVLDSSGRVQHRGYLDNNALAQRVNELAR